MKRPRIQPQQYPEVYEYYAQQKIHPPTARSLHRLFSLIFRPRMTFAAGAERAIDDHYNSGGKLLLVATHLSFADPLVLASVVQRQPALQPLIADVVIPGLAPAFRVPLFGQLVDNFGAIPVFRPLDMKRAGLHGDEAQQVKAAAGRAMIDVCIAKADEGHNVAIFPSGTRWDGKIRSGIGQLACGLNDPARFLLQPVGIDYSQSMTKLRPNVHIGLPFELPRTVEAVIGAVDISLQSCMAAARRMQSA